MLLNDDCLEAMQKLIDDGVQVDSIVTDPPYHLQSIVDRFGKEASSPAQEGTDGAFARASKGFMGQEWDGGDIAFRKETWELALKLLKPGGHLLAFSASRNYHRMAVAIEDAGFEIRDQLMWLYGSGFPKSHNLGDGWGTALKPAHEPIVMARKFIEGTNKNNREKYGTGGINIDGCRVKGKDNPVKWTKPRGGIWKTDPDAKAELVENELGRFPANVMHDGSEEVVSGFPNTGQGGGKPYSYAGREYDNKDTSMFNGDKPQAPSNYNDMGTAARFFYSPKVSKSERGEDNTHPTVKPQELMKYLCRLVTPKGGTVLDPFMGSGSTGMACKDEGFEFIGIEREKEYFEIAEKRIQTASPLMGFM
jgi:site-specific DNA-methyltransferase (adenine-specific)